MEKGKGAGAGSEWKRNEEQGCSRKGERKRGEGRDSYWVWGGGQGEIPGQRGKDLREKGEGEEGKGSLSQNVPGSAESKWGK